MAYGIYFAETDACQILAYQSHLIEELSPQSLTIASHIIPGYVVEHLRLQELLFDAFDGGETLRADLWHPCRVPQVHSIEKVAILAPAIIESFSELLGSLDNGMQEAYRDELAGMVSLFGRAARNARCVVSTLDLPFDEERARLITLPFALETPNANDIP
jgi:hypothetical protein